jgi:hypothetical protein
MSCDNWYNEAYHKNYQIHTQIVSHQAVFAQTIFFAFRFAPRALAGCKTGLAA